MITTISGNRTTSTNSRTTRTQFTERKEPWTCSPPKVPRCRSQRAGVHLATQLIRTRGAAEQRHERVLAGRVTVAPRRSRSHYLAALDQPARRAISSVIHRAVSRVHAPGSLKLTVKTPVTSVSVGTPFSARIASASAAYAS